MKTTELFRTTLLAGVAALALSAQAHAQMQPMEYNGITYVTGGIGLEEREALQAVQSNYNLRILSSGLQGHFVGESLISVRDKSGAELVSTVAGPVFYANLPAGSYTVVGTYNGQSKTQRVTVGGSKTSRISFAWPASEEDTVTDAPRAGDMLVAPYNQRVAPSPYPQSQGY